MAEVTEARYLGTDHDFMSFLRANGLTEKVMKAAMAAKRELKVGKAIVKDIEVLVAAIPKPKEAPSHVEASALSLT